MKKYIYADNAATTKLDIDAFEAMKPYLLDEYGNASQPYSFSRKTKTAIKEAREIIAGCLNAKPEEIFFTSGGTESDNWAIKGTNFNSIDKHLTITSEIEHHAILNSCSAIEKLGFPVVYLKPSKEGVLTYKDLEQVISEKTKLVSIMLANNEIGTIQPIKELCDLAHRYGALFHTDAVQAVGHVSIDVEELGVDMLSASAHKFNGPKGIGFLYMNKDINITPYFHGGSQENKMRAGTENVASIVGMAVALQNKLNNMEHNIQVAETLRNKFFEELNQSGLDYIINGSSDRLPGIINISFKGASGETLLHRLDLMGICISTGSACNTNFTELSHVIKSTNVPNDYAKGTIRISLNEYNTIEEVKTIVESISKILK